MSSDTRNEGRRDRDDRGPRQGGGQGGRRFMRARKSCRFCADKINYIDYKDSRMLVELHTRARQDFAPQDFRHVRASSAHARDRDQARPQRRASPVCDGLISDGGRCASRGRDFDFDLRACSLPASKCKIQQ